MWTVLYVARSIDFLNAATKKFYSVSALNMHGGEGYFRFDFLNMKPNLGLAKSTVFGKQALRDWDHLVSMCFACYCGLV